MTILRAVKKVAARVVYPTYCWYCRALRNFKWSYDDGNDEVYECPTCGTEKRVTVR